MLSEEPTLPACRLAHLIGKPSAYWTVDDLVRVVTERRVSLLSLMHIGGDGWLKTLDFVPRNEKHLRDVLEGGERADGSSLFPGHGIPTASSDILLRPRLSSAFLDPFSPRPSLVLLCSHHRPDGAWLPQSPDTIVRRAEARVAERLGVQLMALGEVEFFLAKRRSESDIYGADDRGYHATAPFVFGESLRRQALGIAGDMGLPVKYAHSEVGYIEPDGHDDRIWEQHEIELSLTPLAEAAEAVALIQWVLRNLAHASGMLCSFAPILRKGHAGSGLHIHFSPMRGGRHLAGLSPDGDLEDAARWLIAGMVAYGDALMAFGNRVEGSFVRLGQGKEAPSRVSWGAFDRMALVRLPVVARDAKGLTRTPPTIEFRLPDGSAHPHLLLAAVAQAMVAGHSLADLDARLERTRSEAVEKNPDAAVRVPTNAEEVAAALEARREVFEAEGVFPPGVIDHLLGSLSASREIGL
ncbi:MAG: glutamine synthetase [Acidobacteriota bacterium]|nr:glutamine synthetase [Acidobacteriota bacterium]MDQ7087717.1 glutamine synthetase [Acidobacteriota bacterium]